METQEFKNLASVSSITENNYKPPIVEIIEISTEKDLRTPLQIGVTIHGKITHYMQVPSDY